MPSLALAATIATCTPRAAGAASAKVTTADKYAVRDMPIIKTYIVEDSPVIRNSLIATLEELVPVDVVGTAEDETTAVQWLTAAGNAFDLVIVDLFLKHGSGLGVLRATHSLRPARHMVVLSNYATKDIRRQCLALGADRVFDKSNDIDALIQYCSDLAAGGPVSGDAVAPN